MAKVEVVWAGPALQLLRQVEVAPGATLRDAVERSGIASEVAGLDPATASYGLFGKVVPATRPVREGDRIEVLRPLQADPKEVRRRLAAEGKSMGKRPIRDGG